MNERIRELAEQAGIKITPMVVDGIEYEDVDMDGSEDLAKFADLIVRECADHCDLLLDHKISSEWSRGTHDCSRAIKKHFGVE
jgi:hypothetical protein